jgi:hypothetical protein
MLRHDQVITPEHFRKSRANVAMLKYCPLKDIDAPLNISSWLCENCFWSKYKEYVKLFAILLVVLIAADLFFALLFAYGNFSSTAEKTFFVVLLIIPGGATLLLLITTGLIVMRQIRKTPGPSMRAVVCQPFVFGRIVKAVYVIRLALSDVRAQEYSPNHLEVTHMNLILEPENWDLRPRNKILGKAVAKFFEGVPSSTTNREEIEVQLIDICLNAMRQAEEIINRSMVMGIGEMRGTFYDPGFSCSLTDKTRRELFSMV